MSTIGSATSHKNVLENPDHISKHVLSKGLDAGTAYEILSIDIADVDVGDNIGAKLQIDQANADKQIAQAKAEERRAMAVALEQEMRARVVEAEAEVPAPGLAQQAGDDRGDEAAGVDHGHIDLQARRQAGRSAVGGGHEGIGAGPDVEQHAMGSLAEEGRAPGQTLPEVQSRVRDVRLEAAEETARIRTITS